VTRWGSKSLAALRGEGKVPAKVSYFHSMRHTFSTLLSMADITEEWRAALCGQAYGGINAKVYDKAKQDVGVTLPKLVAGLQPLEAMFTRVLEDVHRQPNEGTW
jgi:integrase